MEAITKSLYLNIMSTQSVFVLFFCFSCFESVVLIINNWTLASAPLSFFSPFLVLFWECCFDMFLMLWIVPFICGQSLVFFCIAGTFYFYCKALRAVLTRTWTLGSMGQTLICWRRGLLEVNCPVIGLNRQDYMEPNDTGPTSSRDAIISVETASISNNRAVLGEKTFQIVTVYKY